MKKLLLIALVFTYSFTVNAQIETPQPSPFSKVEQKVGLTDFTLEYSRPGVKGRTVFGDLVPYGKVWRTGANLRTKITFNNPITIGGKELKAGTYAIFTIPQATKWEIIFYTEYAGGGAPATLDESKVAARVTAEVHEIPFNVETFTIDLNNLSNSGATLEFIWEKTYVGIPFTVPTDVAVSKNIEKVMAGPAAGDYYAAADYYLQEGKDINKAKVWIDKAIEMSNGDAKFWQLRRQALIYAKSGDKKGAIKAAKASLKLAEEAGNADYVKMNTESIAEWSK
ncbi:DUF2911 domain-containing protein [Oceanihabitans sp. 2_MG-2023]|uniref:DUF2911 domain-containing protein n=1 Tax=Oceanihabitans sp. 2_MG-2023 TaxID=3062661 RepID=UPI0026E2DE0E|nr:DUF2911 domain-containing protein [Oceanihabitans sp. 2_MG-2023]MDO6596951.1 DUF2911 domain-containing protein [Oceanihabitans sp. 2_MG-2023]